MKKSQCKAILDMWKDDKCPRCKKGIMEIVCERLIGEHYYLRCNGCNYSFDE